MEIKGKYHELLKQESGVVYSPLHNITASFPPTIAVHGDADSMVPISDSIALLAVLEKIGVETELVAVPGSEHGLNPAEETKVYVQKGLEFLEKSV